MQHKQYHLEEHSIPDGFRIYRDRVPVMGVAMRKAEATAFCKGSGKHLAFQREPENRHDPNAIRIMGSWKGWFSRKKMIGYVPAEDAAKLVRLGLADSVRPRLMKTYQGTDGFVEIEFQIVGPKDLYRSFNPPPPPKAMSPSDVAANDEAALARLDRLILFLKEAATLAPQQLEKLRRVQSNKTVSRVLETGESYGQASGAPDFLNQKESDFRAHLQ